MVKVNELGIYADRVTWRVREGHCPGNYEQWNGIVRTFHYALTEWRCLVDIQKYARGTGEGRDPCWGQQE
jgi:hypothetical protein